MKLHWILSKNYNELTFVVSNYIKKIEMTIQMTELVDSRMTNKQSSACGPVYWHVTVLVVRKLLNWLAHITALKKYTTSVLKYVMFRTANLVKLNYISCAKYHVFKNRGVHFFIHETKHHKKNPFGNTTILGVNLQPGSTCKAQGELISHQINSDLCHTRF